MCDLLAFIDQHCTGQKFVLLIDNFSLHSCRVEQLVKNEGRLKNLKVIFFPPNVTLLYQPLDQGIIQSFKAEYRRQFLRYCNDKQSIGQDLIQSISIRHTVQWILEGWQVRVSKETIQNCQRHSTCVYLPETTPELTGELELVSKLELAGKGTV